MDKIEFKLRNLTKNPILYILLLINIILWGIILYAKLVNMISSIAAEIGAAFAH